MKVEFLREIGSEPAQSTSRNPLESPWGLEVSEFVKRARKYGTPNVRAYKLAREETLFMTEEAGRVEREIDERVQSLYGL